MYLQEHIDAMAPIVKIARSQVKQQELYAYARWINATLYERIPKNIQNSLDRIISETSFLNRVPEDDTKVAAELFKSYYQYLLPQFEKDYSLHTRSTIITALGMFIEAGIRSGVRYHQFVGSISSFFYGTDPEKHNYRSGMFFAISNLYPDTNHPLKDVDSPGALTTKIVDLMMTIAPSVENLTMYAAKLQETYRKENAYIVDKEEVRVAIRNVVTEMWSDTYSGIHMTELVNAVAEKIYPATSKLSAKIIYKILCVSGKVKETSCDAITMSITNIVVSLLPTPFLSCGNTYTAYHDPLSSAAVAGLKLAIAPRNAKGPDWSEFYLSNTLSDIIRPSDYRRAIIAVMTEMLMLDGCSVDDLIWAIIPVRPPSLTAKEVATDNTRHLLDNAVELSDRSPNTLKLVRNENGSPINCWSYSKDDRRIISRFVRELAARCSEYDLDELCGVVACTLYPTANVPSRMILGRVDNEMSELLHKMAATYMDQHPDSGVGNAINWAVTACTPIPSDKYLETGKIACAEIDDPIIKLQSVTEAEFVGRQQRVDEYKPELIRRICIRFWRCAKESSDVYLPIMMAFFDDVISFMSQGDAVSLLHKVPHCIPRSILARDWLIRNVGKLPDSDEDGDDT